jgi:hypothetical protein
MGIDAVTTRKIQSEVSRFWGVFHHSFFLYHLTQLGHKKKMQKSIGDRKPNNNFLKGVIFELFQIFFGNICLPYSQGTWMNQLLTKLVIKFKHLLW